MKKYNIIYADPPWEYQDKANAGKRGACHKYPTMGIQSLAQLPVKEMLHRNAVLFLWVTMPMIADSFKIITFWGFEYKTCAFVWIKQNANRNTLFMGMGNWTRANAELCLLATRGKLKRINAGIEQVVLSPIREHSRKPDIVRQRIVELMGDLPRIELFARKDDSQPDMFGYDRFEGWDVWGNEAEGSVDFR